MTEHLVPRISIKQAKILPFNIVKPVLHEIEFLIKIIFFITQVYPSVAKLVPKG